jgi:hypothetical protein
LPETFIFALSFSKTYYSFLNKIARKNIPSLQTPIPKLRQFPKWDAHGSAIMRKFGLISTCEENG